MKIGFNTIEQLFGISIPHLRKNAYLEHNKKRLTIGHFSIIAATGPGQ